MARRLPDEIVALIHHIELTESGWWDTALERFAIGIVAATGAIHPAELPLILRREYGIAVDVATLEPRVAALADAGDFIVLPDGRVKLSERTSEQVRSDVERTEARSRRLEGRFISALIDEGVDVDPSEAWARLQVEVLTPLVQELGARTYELLEQEAAANSPANFLGALGPTLRSFSEREKLAIVAFLDPDDPDVRAYLLQTLNAYFFVEASALGADTLERLREAQKRKHEMRVIVDTNFLFSILRLHDNPTNETAETADALLSHISDQLRVRLYVLPITVEEATNTLGVQIESLAGIRLSGNLARAVVEETEMPGLTKRYMQEAAGSQYPLTPQDFFGPYQSNLVAVLRERGVELFNESMDSYRTDQEVIDDVMVEEEYQTAKRFRGPKPYESNLHDMVLWHFAKRKRPGAVESPLDAIYWIVTEDFGFMGFDRWKRNGHGLPVCVSPAALIQLLRFWIPRSEELEKALVASLRAPFLFPDFDLVTERLTARILRTISRFEGIADLSVDTIREILMGDAMRQRIASVPPGTEEEVILRDAFVQQTHLMEERLRAVEGERDAVSAERNTLDQEMKTTAKIAAELSTQVKADHERLRELEDKADSAEKKAALRADELSSREESWEKEKAQDARRWFILFTGLFALVCAGLGTGLWFVLATVDWPIWLRLLGSSVAAICTFLLACQFVGATVLGLGDWHLVRALVRARVALWGLIGATAAGFLATAIFEAWRHRK